MLIGVRSRQAAIIFTKYNRTKYNEHKSTASDSILKTH